MENKTLTISVEAEELGFILSVLGELPTKSGAFPLVMKLKTQGDAQLAEKSKVIESVEEAPQTDIAEEAKSLQDAR